jgi:hypothetical protein
MPAARIAIDQDAGAAPSPKPAQSQPPAIQFVPPANRPPLPDIDGLLPEEVSAFIGPPFATQVLKDKRLAWSYATPDGVQVVYFRPESVTGSAGTTKAPARAPAPAKPPAASPLPPNGCDGIVARGPVASLIVVMPRTPAFVTPQIRQDALTTFAPFTTLMSLGTSGAWYLVTFQGARGPQSGYVHCTDVTVAR